MDCSCGVKLVRHVSFACHDAFCTIVDYQIDKRRIPLIISPPVSARFKKENLSQRFTSVHFYGLKRKKNNYQEAVQFYEHNIKC
jgi:hypothetical protein